MKELKFHGDKVIIGANSLEYLKEINITKVFIVTGGKSVFENGTMDRIKEMIKDKKLAYYIFSGVRQNPDTEIIKEGIEVMRKFAPQEIIAIGGGSVIDAAKIMALFYENEDLTFEEARKGNIPSRRNLLKFIAIPTTSGTGTEVTEAAVVTFKKENIKVGLKSKAFIPDIAILDPILTLTMPNNVVAETGMDALTHAVESYINNRIDNFTEIMAKGVIEGLIKYLPKSYQNKDIESREKVHDYQSMAGMILTNVGLGMSHGISHAIGGRYNLSHGLINAVALPYVLMYNRRDEWVDKRLKVLEKTFGWEDFILEIKKLNNILNIPSSFKELGIDEEDFKEHYSQLVENSLKGSTMKNPIPINKIEMEKILKSIYEGKEI